MTVFLLVVAVVVTLAGAAFCAGAETGFLSVSRERILHLAREGGRKARIVQAALAEMGRTMTTLLIGNNLMSVAYSSATAALSAELFDNSLAKTLWAFFAAFLVLYVSEFMPKLLAAARPLRRILLMADAYRWMAALLRPLTAVAMRLTDLFLPRKDAKYKLTIEDLMRILEDRRDGVCLSDFESALISRLVVLRVKRRPVTAEAILSALRDEGGGEDSEKESENKTKGGRP